jgi:hypothetical protein
MCTATVYNILVQKKKKEQLGAPKNYFCIYTECITAATTSKQNHIHELAASKIINTI